MDALKWLRKHFEDGDFYGITDEMSVEASGVDDEGGRSPG